MDKKSEEYLSQYIKLTNKIKQKMEPFGGSRIRDPPAFPG